MGSKKSFFLFFRERERVTYAIVMQSRTLGDGSTGTTVQGRGNRQGEHGLLGGGKRQVEHLASRRENRQRGAPQGAGGAGGTSKGSTGCQA